ncbi:MAG: hypothetical protein K1Y36_10300 [Blastocatellia bacterium]|nr:hypothetical protein [Blastocatellia bacterium]
MNWLFRAINQNLVCSHSQGFEWVENFYGHSILIVEARSLWRCPNCGKLRYSQELNREIPPWVDLGISYEEWMAMTEIEKEATSK